MTQIKNIIWKFLYLRIEVLFDICYLSFDYLPIFRGRYAKTVRHGQRNEVGKGIIMKRIEWGHAHS
jgi:hypothetical protein